MQFVPLPPASQERALGEALKNAEEALAIFRKLDHSELAADTLVSIAQVFLAQGLPNTIP